MKIEDFIAGKSIKCYKYSCFVPSLINHEWTWEAQDLTCSLEKAAKALASLDACSQFVPDIDLFIRMHIVREASASSRIEGTQTEMEEAILPETSIEEERRNDWREVNNYVDAMASSIDALKTLPLSMRLLREAHRRLLSGVRGEHKSPGEIRTSQNWIGGHSISTARFIPPAPEFVPDLLGDLEKFWHNEDIKASHLVRCAISHYQFESIHPFLDGSGRVGRLLIPFYLMCNHELSSPSLYISAYFEHNRDMYYDALAKVRTDNDLIGWVLFFLEAIKETAQIGCDKFKRIFALRDEMNEYSQSCANTALMQKLFKRLYSFPRMTINQVSESIGCSYLAANRMVKKLEKDGLLVPATDAKRNVIYDFRRYLEIFKT
jgi:Fic family protein